MKRVIWDILKILFNFSETINRNILQVVYPYVRLIVFSRKRCINAKFWQVKITLQFCIIKTLACAHAHYVVLLTYVHFYDQINSTIYTNRIKPLSKINGLGYVSHYIRQQYQWWKWHTQFHKMTILSLCPYICTYVCILFRILMFLLLVRISFLGLY